MYILNITFSVDMYDSEQGNVIHPSTNLHVFWPKLSEHQFTTLRTHEETCLELSKLNVATLSQKEFYRFLYLFMIFTLSNNDVIRGIPGYFKCR